MGGRFLAELRAAPGEIHLLDHRFEWEPVARKQLLYFAPAVERAEGIEMLQKKIARLQRFFERNRVERFLIFPFAIQPHRQRGEPAGIGIFPIVDGAGDERIALRLIRMDAQVEREQFVLRFGQWMFFQRVGQIDNWRDTRRRVLLAGRHRGRPSGLARERALGENDQHIEADRALIGR